MNRIRWEQIRRIALIPLGGLASLVVIVALTLWGVIFPIVLAVWILVGLILLIPRGIARFARYLATTPQDEILKTVGAIAVLAGIVTLLILSEVNAR